jgi:hypothetical protein
MAEWLCTQERFNPEVVIIFGMVARYRRAKVGSSHDDLHPNNSTLHTRAVRFHSGFVGRLFFISPRMVFCSIRVHDLFVRGMQHQGNSVGLNSNSN